MKNDVLNIKRALLSVSDKTNIEKVAKALVSRGVEIISSGGTGSYLEKNDINYTPIEKVTGNPEAFSGRMKTLSFQVSSSLLYRRENNDDILQAKELGILGIELVICNLYPFKSVVDKNGSEEELVENIDIGGPTMIRAAAKNFNDVCVLTSPDQYDQFLESFSNDQLDFQTRKKFSLRAFKETAYYDLMIVKEFTERWEKEEACVLGFDDRDAVELRYGENPHQRGWVYKDLKKKGLASITPLQGKPLSYNNLLDADAAWRSACDIAKLNDDQTYVVSVVKHSNSCGLAVSSDSLDALENAWAGDPISAFGGILCFSKEVDVSIANWLSNKFIEIVIAPSFSKDALEVFAKKKNLRLLELPMSFDFSDEYMVRSISGGVVVQQEDTGADQEFQCATVKNFDEEMISLAHFGTMACKHLRSNAIALVKKTNEGMSLIGAGMGNPNRLISMEQAINKAKSNGHDNLAGAILISDAFFPFADNIEIAGSAGIQFIVQPGGSIKDKDVVNACNERNMAMVFTGRRHFRH